MPTIKKQDKATCLFCWAYGPAVEIEGDKAVTTGRKARESKQDKSGRWRAKEVDEMAKPRATLCPECIERLREAL